MNNPLYENIKSIAESSVDKHGKIQNYEFDSIRNRESVRAVLKQLGYKPNNEVRASYWRVNKPRKKRIYTEQAPRPKYDELVSKFKKDGKVYFDSLGVSRTHAYRMIANLKKDGWEIDAIYHKPKGSNQKQTIGWTLEGSK